MCDFKSHRRLQREMRTFVDEHIMPDAQASLEQFKLMLSLTDRI